MEEIHISVPTPYTVFVGSGILPFASEEAARLSCGRRALLLSDSHVYPLYGRKTERELAECGFECESFVVPAGERAKSPRKLFELWNYMAQGSFTRDSVLISLGGGVVSDLGGFAASSYMRGISHFIFPTTLLSMCDAGIGGKTAINLPGGKNLAGAFYPPKAVFCDTDFLQTLPASVYSDGIAEVIKYGLISSPEILDGLINSMSLAETVKRCAEIKKSYIEADEKDLGVRRLLNFGHTLAHAAEKLSHGRISHGRAVAAGMYVTSRAAVKKGLCSEEVLKIQDTLFNKYSLPKSFPYSVGELCAAALADKKRTGGDITLIIPVAVGRAEMLSLPTAQLEDFYSDAYET